MSPKDKNDQVMNELPNNYIFKSPVGVFIFYHCIKALTFSAFVLYFLDFYYFSVSIGFMLMVILINAYRNNVFFIITEKELIVKDVFFGSVLNKFLFNDVEKIEIKFSFEKDQRQWLALRYHKDTKIFSKKFRCDWLHHMDASIADHDDSLEHELFELLKDEDFFDGSIQQLFKVCQQKCSDCTEVFN